MVEGRVAGIKPGLQPPGRIPVLRVVNVVVGNHIASTGIAHDDELVVVRRDVVVDEALGAGIGDSLMDPCE